MLSRFSIIAGKSVIQVLCGLACLVFFTWPVMTGFTGGDPLSTFINVFIVWSVFVCALFILTRTASLPESDGDDHSTGSGSE